MTPSQQRILTIGLMTLGVLIVGFFGLRTFHAFREFRGHRPPGHPFGDKQAVTDVELIRDWMTIGSLSHMYNTPPRLLYDALGIPPNGNEKKSLKQLNDKYFPDQPGYVISTVKTAIQANLPPAAAPLATTSPTPVP
jgi:hypothetical protein